MAETALVAFGRYVRMLRERKGLSLESATSLTRVYPSPVSKGYLSRVENGRTRIGFDKVIAVARAYDVPVEVIAERMRLDLELDSMNPPDTAGMNVQEMLHKGGEAMRKGARWEGYALFRDAGLVARDGPVLSRYRDRGEQIGLCLLNTATAATRLSALRYALHEYQFVESERLLSAKYVCTLSTLLSTAHHHLGEHAAAVRYCDRAIEEALAVPDRKYLGYCYGMRGVLAGSEQDDASAITFHQKAIEAYRAAGLHADCASSFANIAQCYANLNRIGAARRALNSAEKLAVQFGADAVRVRVRILLGEIEANGGHEETARALWQEASELAKRLGDRSMTFKVDFQLFKQAVRLANSDTAQALRKRLTRMAPWVDAAMEELAEFRALAGSNGGPEFSVHVARREPADLAFHNSIGERSLPRA